jgi:hypothetical protein
MRWVLEARARFPADADAILDEPSGAGSSVPDRTRDVTSGAPPDKGGGSLFR